MQNSFLEDVRVSVIRGPLCSVRMIMAQIAQDDEVLSKEVQEALAQDTMYQASAISRELKRRGYDLSGSTISRHRRGQCSCPKK